MQNTVRQYLLQILGVLLLCVFVGYGGFRFMAQQAEGAEWCHTISSPNASLREGYGSPLNMLSPLREQLITVLCSRTGAVVHTGNGSKNLLIYEYGYERIGGTWKRFAFNGGEKREAWYVGNASGAVTAGSKGRFVVYMCQLQNNTWKCGCRDKVCNTAYWQGQEYSAPDFVTSEDTLEDDTVNDEALDVYAPSTHFARPGDRVQLTGTGFATAGKGNDILWNKNAAVKGVLSTNGSVLSFVVPELAPGKYEIHVRRGAETTEFSTVIWITTPSPIPPTVTKIVPEHGKQGDTFTLYGEGLTATQNDLVTTFGTFSKTASDDGQSISFVYDPFEEEVKFWTEDHERYHYSQPIYVTVANTSGMSNTVIFYLDI